MIRPATTESNSSKSALRKLSGAPLSHGDKMPVVGSPGKESGEASQTLREFYAEIEAAGGSTLSAEDHRVMTADIRADRGVFTSAKTE